MKKILLIISYLAIIGCQSKQEIKSHVNNKESIRLTKKAMKIVFLKENEIEKVDSAIILLKKAINIDPKYIEPRLNLIRLLINKKSYSAALSNCRDLQKNYPNSPIYLIIEGFVYEKCNNNKLATTKYRKALEQYENIQNEEINQNPTMKIEYIQCLLLNKKNVKAKRQLSELKKENPIYNSLSIELLMEGYKEFTSN